MSIFDREQCLLVAGCFSLISLKKVRRDFVKMFVCDLLIFGFFGQTTIECVFNDRFRMGLGIALYMRKIF